MGILKGVVVEFLTAGSPTRASASRNLSKQIPPLLEAANLHLWVKFASAYSREQFLSLHRLLELWLVAAVAPLGTHFPRCNPPCHPPGDHQLQSYSQKQLELVTQIRRTVAPRETLAPRYSVPCSWEEKHCGWEERRVRGCDGPSTMLCSHKHHCPHTQAHSHRDTCICLHTHTHPHRHTGLCSHIHAHLHRHLSPCPPHIHTHTQIHGPLLPRPCASM